MAKKGGNSVKKSAPRASLKPPLQGDRLYAAQDALRTLQQAEMHRSDNKLMSDVRRLATHQQRMLSRVAKPK